MCERAVAAPLPSQCIVYPILSEKSLLRCEKTVKDEDSFYHVRSQKENEKQIRLEKFYKAKEENVSFYLKHFVKR